MASRRADMLKRETPERKDLDEDLSSDDDGYLKLPSGGLSPKCDDSDEDKGGDAKRGRSAVKVVTQKEAKAWFDRADAVELGHGANGIVKALVLDEESPVGRVVAIKRSFVEGDEKESQFQHIDDVVRGAFQPRGDVLANAKHEVEHHLLVYDELRCDPACVKWIAQPAAMEWEELTNDNGVFMVQELVYDKACAQNDPTKWEDCRSVTFMSVKDVDLEAANDKKLYYLMGTDEAADERKKEFCRDYGRILACLARAKILHADVHDENLMVFTNYTKGKAPSKGEAYLRWAGIIDWGLAEQVPGEGPLRGDVLCQMEPYEVGYRPRLQPLECYGEVNESMEIASSFAELLWGNASCVGKDETLCGTEGLVRQCIHEGFAGTLELRIPSGIQKEVRREHLEEFKQRGGRLPPAPSRVYTPLPSAAAVRAAIRGMGMPNLSNLVI